MTPVLVLGSVDCVFWIDLVFLMYDLWFSCFDLVWCFLGLLFCDVALTCGL